MATRPALETLLRPQESRSAVKGALALLAMAVHVTGFAATDAVPDCGRMARDLQSLEVAAGTLATEIVDLAVGSDTEAMSAPFDASGRDAEAQSPLLYLAPRLDLIVKDVFDAVAVDSGSGADRSDNPESISAEAKHPPVADSLTETTESNAERQLPTPRFQRQMYRTDI
ncbi:MAG: hypothetical protein OEW35_03395 [Gammaproteobacteria bacterium]|nr:hypothetical protein [Gammaproteobacteria bacterium]MDH4255677.1 hypothetical protein [Gammaproteobacteria bacterium]MDH5308708.1 hypothetical protein [Gammaproteobacteria bacterium]